MKEKVRLIKLEKVNKKFKDFEINIDFEMFKGEIYGLIGKSGSGKSSILKIIQGLLKYDEGKIYKNDNLEISYVFQEFNLLNNKTVFENVALPLRLRGKFEKNKVNEAIKFVGLENRKEMYISSLSGGEKQRVGIARAIVSNPDLILCDEVTASLDKIVKNEILFLFKKINEKYGTSILLVTHELDVAKVLCDRVSVIEKGSILETFDVDKIDIENIEKNYLDYVKEVLLWK
ncbi:MAG: ATP-binding cassette domain-containing protein [Streptobacillus sp.]